MATRGTRLDAVYSGRWDELPPRELNPGVQPAPWSSQVPSADAEFSRWYPHESVEAVLADGPD